MSVWQKKFPFTGHLNLDGSKSTKRDVYWKGNGPPLLIMHELPGLSVETFNLGQKYVEEGFRVYLPLLTGKVGDNKQTPLSLGLESLRLFCISREIHMMRSKSSSPITIWLRDLCNYIRQENNHEGVGVIGMCLTGNFALTLMADDSVLGAVAAQPSIPFRPKKGIHMSKSDIQGTIDRLDSLGHYIRAYRFKDDKVCPPEKFSTLNETFNKTRSRIILETLEHEPQDENLHSVLVYSFEAGGELTQKVLRDTVRYFQNSFEKFG